MSIGTIVEPLLWRRNLRLLWSLRRLWGGVPHFRRGCCTAIRLYREENCRNDWKLSPSNLAHSMFVPSLTAHQQIGIRVTYFLYDDKEST